MRKKTFQRAFTLIEVIVALFVVSMGTAGVFTLMEQIGYFTSQTSFRVRAMYLAQEGVELVRNVRDTNYAKAYQGENVSWLDGLGTCETECQTDYDMNCDGAGTQFCAYDGSILKRSSSGYYNYQEGTSAGFKRKITVTPRTGPGGEEMADIIVDVYWIREGQDDDRFRVQVQETMYNWLFP